jgi:hypothetical protein
VVSVQLALRSAFPFTRRQIAEEYAALLAKDPLLLPQPGGKIQRPDPYAKSSLPPRPAPFTPQRTLLGLDAGEWQPSSNAVI